jgi:hypothetical protein
MNKYHFRARVNDEELNGPEVPHSSLNGEKYIVDLLFIVNISSIYFVILDMQIICLIFMEICKANYNNNLMK